LGRTARASGGSRRRSPGGATDHCHASRTPSSPGAAMEVHRRTQRGFDPFVFPMQEAGEKALRAICRARDHVSSRGCIGNGDTVHQRLRRGWAWTPRPQGINMINHSFSPVTAIVSGIVSPRYGTCWQRILCSPSSLVLRAHGCAHRSFRGPPCWSPSHPWTSTSDSCSLRNRPRARRCGQGSRPSGSGSRSVGRR